MQAALSIPGVMVVFSILAYLLAILVIVFIHEMGHFLVGRWCGVRIEAFSLGFGKEIWGFNDKHGTRWKFCWIPMGGYVKFEGDANAASMPDFSSAHSPTSLPGAKLWKRFLIVAAGPVANFLLAIAIFASAYMFVGSPVNEPRVDDVLAGSAAEQAGLKTGDFIRSIDGAPIGSFGEIQDAMLLHGEVPIALVIDRAGQMQDITLTPKFAEVDDGFGGKVMKTQIGIVHDGKLDPQSNVKYGPVEAVAKASRQTWLMVETTLRYVGKVFQGTESTSQLHGPLGVAKVAGEAAVQGPWTFIAFIGFISVSIGLINLFPIPILDGGHLLFYIVEAVIGRPVSAAAQEWSFRIGLTAILMLVVLVTVNDIPILRGH